MLRGDDGKDLACLAYYPQCEVYNSDLDMRNSLAGAADNPDVSLTTQADSSARGVKIDLAVVLHHPYVHVDSPNLPLDGKTSTTINELFEYICDPDNPGGGVFDPTKYSVLRIAQTDLVLYIEIKPPVSRRGDLPTYLRNVHRGVRDATEDADQQFSCAMLSWRYSHCESAWLLGGAGDVFSLRRAIRHGARVFSHRLYVERRRGEMIRRAIDNLSQDGPDEGILDVDSILSSKPPFSDAEIHAFIDENPDHKMYAFERLTSAAGMAKNLYSGNWTKPMRIGSPVANFYMQLVRDDILKRARKEVSRWDDVRNAHTACCRASHQLLIDRRLDPTHLAGGP